MVDNQLMHERWTNLGQRYSIIRYLEYLDKNWPIILSYLDNCKKIGRIILSYLDNLKKNDRIISSYLDNRYFSHYLIRKNSNNFE